MIKIKSNIAFLLYIFYFFCGEPTEAIAQSNEQDTSNILPTIEVNSTKTRLSVAGSISEEWQTAQLDKLPINNLANLLNTEAGTYIKSYGQGSLATASIRGGNAGHTLVLWNGLPIQSPMLGLLDLALLPVQTAETITFTKGGNAAMWGSGAIGGVINLGNEADFSKRFNIKSNSQFGSFGQIQQQIKAALGNEKLQSVTKLSYQKADNDFHYFLADGLPKRQQTNAKLSQQFLIQDLYWTINNKNKLAVHFWRQQTNRQIPPTSVQNQSEAHQNDLTIRLLLEFKHINNKTAWNVKTGFFNEHLNYFDDRILLESPSYFRTYLAEITGQWFWKKHEWLIGNFHTQTRAWSAGYQNNIPREYKTALFTSWRYNGEKCNYQVSLRQEMVDEKLVPLVPVFGFDWYCNPNLTLKGKISRNYRLPTLNDRFWLPGGNPELLPESGWSQELTLARETKKNKLVIKYSLTAFNRNIDNWILWSVKDDQSFWSANNITKVWSRGLEPRLSANYQYNNIQYKWRLGYDYIRSTNQVTLQNPKMAAGDQLIYTPIHQAFGSFSIDWNHLHFAYQQHFTGAAAGVNQQLDAFQVGSVRLQYSNDFKKYKGTLFFNINNIWNTDYLVVERRPMPGIHFQAGLNLSNNKIK